MYVLHYAPDNASIIVRIAMEELGVPYATRLVDRRTRGQDAPAHRAVAPTGLVPALTTPNGTLFETAAILLWLAETHGGLMPRPGAPGRGDWLKWFVFTATTVHADLRLVFYPQQYAGDDARAQRALHDGATARLRRHWLLLETAADRDWLAAAAPDAHADALAIYVCALLRWSQIYAAQGTGWLDVSGLPRLRGLAHALDRRPAVTAVAVAEGLGPWPFSDPQLPDPPEGSAT